MNIKIPEIVVAVDRYGGFGKDGKIPWDLPEDLKHFQQLTTGHVCVMGRRTFDSILDTQIVEDAARGSKLPVAKILSNRDSYVVTSNKNYKTLGATQIDDLRKVQTQMVGDPRKLFVIGGYRLYVQALSSCTTVHMTVLKTEQKFNCDVSFPIQVLNKKFQIVSGKETENAYYVEYQRN